MASVRFLGLLPFCVRVADPEDEPFPKAYSAAMSVADACKLFWRVKAWKLEVSVVREPFAANFEDSASVDVSYQKQINSEADLVCVSKSQSEFSVTKTDPDFDSGTGEDTWGFVLFGDAIRQEGSQLIRPKIIAFAGSSSDLEISWDGQTLEAVDFPGGAGSYLRMSPSKWRAYDPGDGRGPTYDEDTGKRLR